MDRTSPLSAPASWADCWRTRSRAATGRARFCLIDDTGRVAEGKALDIMQAGAGRRLRRPLTGSTDTSLAGGRGSRSSIADRVGGGEWQGEDGAGAPDARSATSHRKRVILCAGASQRELIDRGVRELHIRRSRLFGSAPEALAAGARAGRARRIDGVAARRRAHAARRPARAPRDSVGGRHRRRVA